MVNPRLRRGSAGGLPEFDISGSKESLLAVNRSERTAEEASDGRSRNAKSHHMGLHVPYRVDSEVPEKDAVRRAPEGSGRGIPVTQLFCLRRAQHVEHPEPNTPRWSRGVTPGSSLERFVTPLNRVACLATSLSAQWAHLLVPRGQVVGILSQHSTNASMPPSHPLLPSLSHIPQCLRPTLYFPASPPPSPSHTRSPSHPLSLCPSLSMFSPLPLSLSRFPSATTMRHLTSNDMNLIERESDHDTARDMTRCAAWRRQQLSCTAVVPMIWKFTGQSMPVVVEQARDER